MRGAEDDVGDRAEGLEGQEDDKLSIPLEGSPSVDALARWRLWSRFRQWIADECISRCMGFSRTAKSNQPGRPCRVLAIVCHLFPYFSNALHSCSSSSAVQGSLPVGNMGQGLRRGRTVLLTNGWINSFLVALCTLVIGSSRKRPGNLIPSFTMFCDRFEKNDILLRCPTTCVGHERGIMGCEMVYSDLSGD